MLRRKFRETVGGSSGVERRAFTTERVFVAKVMTLARKRRHVRSTFQTDRVPPLFMMITVISIVDALGGLLRRIVQAISSCFFGNGRLWGERELRGEPHRKKRFKSASPRITHMGYRRVALDESFPVIAEPVF